MIIRLDVEVTNVSLWGHTQEFRATSEAEIAIVGVDISGPANWAHLTE